MLTACHHRPFSPSSYVDPLIGTAGTVEHGFGNTFPGAAWPFGMIQLSPDNGDQGWPFSSGYHYADSFIAGFSHLHLSGTGVGDLADISVMPTLLPPREEYFLQPPAFVRNYLRRRGWPLRSFLNRDGMRDTFQYNFLLAFRSRFSHEDEEASPGYYRVLLSDPGIVAEMTVSEFTGMHRYRYPAGRDTLGLVINLGFHINRDKPVEGFLRLVNDTLLTGLRRSTGWADNQHVYFAMTFSRPVTHISYFLADSVRQDTHWGARLAVYLAFDAAGNGELLVRTALSSVSVEEALANLHTADTFGWHFDRMRTAARQAWDRELGRIQVKGGDPVRTTIFYTALYHTFLEPCRYSDAEGTWRNYLGQPDTTGPVPQYGVLSLWDIFRAEAPLIHLLRPGIHNAILHSMMRKYRQTGLLPYWEIWGDEGGSMTGYHAVVLLADGILKGTTDLDPAEVLRAMDAIANTDREGLQYYRKYHYVPADLERSGTVSKTLEYAYDDGCIARVAEAAGHDSLRRIYEARSGYWKNLFDTSLHIFRGRNSDGSWYEPFLPRLAQYGNPLCVEGNIWQYTFFVPHDLPGLMQAMGGRKGFVTMLDSLFTQSSDLLGEDTEDVTGMIGQYAHGNEPDHHVAYLYDLAGHEERTQYYVHRIRDSLYAAAPDGLCGNEDCGQMSAWYVFSSLGLYPLNPVDGRYWLGTPAFPEAVIDVGGGRRFRIIARHLSEKNIYVARCRLNGRPLQRPWITWQELTTGGELLLEMSDVPPSRTPSTLHP